MKDTQDHRNRYTERVEKLAVGTSFVYRKKTITLMDLCGDRLWVTENNSKGYADCQLLVEFGNKLVDELISNNSTI